MQTVNIAELKNRLSHYLDDVRRGEEVVIKDRNTPIAKIVPLAATDDYETEEAGLVAAGILRLPEKKGLPAWFWEDAPGGGVSVERIVEVIRSERDED